MRNVSRLTISLAIAAALVGCEDNFHSKVIVHNPSNIGNPATPTSPPAVVPDSSVCDGYTLDAVNNGSFEEVNNSTGQNGRSQSALLTTATYDIFSDVSGWQSTTTDGIELWGNNFNGVPASHGQVFSELKPNMPSGITQQICTLGGPRQVFFDLYARTGVLPDNGVEVLLDGVVVGTFNIAHSFWKTYSVDLGNLSPGVHDLTFQAINAGEMSRGALIDHIGLSSLDSVTARKNVGVSTIILALSEEQPLGDAVNQMKEAVDYVSPVLQPLVLLVKAVGDSGESAQEYTFLLTNLTALGYSVTVVSEPSAGLTPSDVSGYDVVWLANPGHPLQRQLSIDTLYDASRAQQLGVVLSGDDITSSAYVQSENLTLMKNTDNGTSACNQAIDNNSNAYHYIVSHGSNVFNYGNDIDWSFIFGGSIVETMATAVTSVPFCSVEIPVITRYRINP